MPAYLEKSGTWSSVFRYKDWEGALRQKHKRGFETSEDANAYEAQFLAECKNPMSITFGRFVDIYLEDVSPRTRLSTKATKERNINLKILPVFSQKVMKEITAKDVLRWQNLMKQDRTKTGKPYSQTYLRALNDQLVAIFNHAVKHYGLSENPAKQIAKIGNTKGEEMQVWSKEEYLRFADDLG